MTQENADGAGDILIAALKLARERTVSWLTEEKLAKRHAIKEAISGIQARQATGEGGPSAEEIRELLGDPDDKSIRRALEAWDAQ